MVRVDQRRPLRLDGCHDKHPPSSGVRIWIETWKDDAVVVATRCGPCGKPRRGFPSSARAERHVHTDSRDAVDSCSGNHPLSEQVLNENGRVALRAQSAQTDRTSEQVAVAAATLAEEALTAPAALVDRVGAPALCGAGEPCAHWSNRRWGFDDGLDNCVVGKRACSTARVSRGVVRRTSSSRPDHHAKPHGWACRCTTSWPSVRPAAARPCRRRTAGHAGSCSEKRSLLMCSTHCVLWSTSAVLSLESTVGAVGGRRCRGDQFAVQ